MRSERIEKLERRRSNLIDMGADGTIGREDLRAKLAEADEERNPLRRALGEAAGRSWRGCTASWCWDASPPCAAWASAPFGPRSAGPSKMPSG